MARITLERILTIDSTGLPKAPSITQILDKDVKALWIRDKSPDKSMYIKEAGVIYYLADPKQRSGCFPWQLYAPGGYRACAR